MSKEVFEEVKPRKTKSKRRLRKKQIAFAVELVLLIMLSGVLFLWNKVNQITWDTTLAPIKFNEITEETQEVLEGYTTVALFGVDNRSVGDYDTGNSDSIMIVSINNATKETRIVSLFRDTYLQVTDTMYRKCNHAYNTGGPQLALEMINRNLDLNVQDYAAVDFYAVAKAVNAVGGIEMTLSKEEAYWMNYTYIDHCSEVTGIPSSHVSEGTQILDGIQTVAYCRVRYTAGDDFKRTSRQRDVIMKLYEKAMNASPSELSNLIDAVFPSISTSFTAPELLELAKDVKQYQITETHGFPFELTTGEYGSLGSLVVPCTLEENVSQLHHFMYNEENYNPTQTVKDISIYIQSNTGTNVQSALDSNYFGSPFAEGEAKDLTAKSSEASTLTKATEISN